MGTASGSKPAPRKAGPRRALSLPGEEFLSWLAAEKGRSTNTLAAYRRDLSAYEVWLRDRGIELATVTETTVARYTSQLKGSGLAPASVARALVVLRCFHRFLQNEGTVVSDPASGLKPPRVPQALPKALSEAEVGALLGAVAGNEPAKLRDRAILEVLYGTGMRVSELTGLSLADLAVEDQLARVFGKGSKERLVPLGRYARAALEDWLGTGGRQAVLHNRRVGREDSGAVFLNLRGRRLTRQGIDRIVRSYAGRVGLGRRASAHVLRHSCATHLLDHGADIRVVQELLGHASIATTQVYTKVSAERLRAAYEAAHPRARGDFSHTR
ncbi:MAG TPA: site-specific tyrosine recombinase XerD [Acidimicrobiales bacterium]|nr:site-specific tyrosine recombinase XerD [Acidimicrobiales bacterium]